MGAKIGIVRQSTMVDLCNNLSQVGISTDGNFLHHHYHKKSNQMGEGKMNIEIDSPTSEEILAEIDELRQREIDFLLEQRRAEEKKSFELSVRELMTILNIDRTSVYSYMEKLVTNETWGTRMALDPEIHKTIRVWWLLK
jgi:hypothetical protein